MAAEADTDATLVPLKVITTAAAVGIMVIDATLLATLADDETLTVKLCSKLPSTVVAVSGVTTPLLTVATASLFEAQIITLFVALAGEIVALTTPTNPPTNKFNGASLKVRPVTGTAGVETGRLGTALILFKALLKANST